MITGIGERVQAAFEEAKDRPDYKREGLAAQIICTTPAPISREELGIVQRSFEKEYVKGSKKIAEEAVRAGSTEWILAFLSWRPRLLVEGSLLASLRYKLVDNTSKMGRGDIRRLVDTTVDIFHTKRDHEPLGFRCMLLLTDLFKEHTWVQGGLSARQISILERGVERYNQNSYRATEFKRILLAGYAQERITQDKPGMPKF